MLDIKVIFERLRETFPGQILQLFTDNVDPWIEVQPQALVEVSQFLRDEPDLAFDFLNCISAVDYFDPKLRDSGIFQPRIELLYHLTSLQHRHRLVLKVILPRWKDNLEGALPEVASVSKIWPTAEWHEREIFDLMGVRFLSHPDLRRILCPEDWVGHPLRKDYVIPEEYQGIPLK
jgi:NADH-quinone oxidoreductase subunit C